MSLQRSKPPYGLILIIVLLVAFSASILLTQEKTEIDPEAQELINPAANLSEIDIPQGTPSSVYQSLINQGDIAFSDRQFSRALSYYIAAYRVNKDTIAPFLKIIDVYLLTENYPVALKNIELAKSRSSKDPAVILRDLRYQLAQEDIASANNIVTANSNSSENIKLYGAITAMMANQHDEAQQTVTELATNAKDPKIKDIATTFTTAYELYGTFESGNESYRDTLLGQALIQMQEYKLARDLFYRAIRSQNDYRDAWIGLGYAFLQIKNYKQTEEALNKAKTIDAYKPETYFYQAIANEEQGNYKRALGLLTQASNFDYDNPIEISEHLATNYYALSEYEKAINYYEQVINAKKVPLNYFIAPIWIHLEQTKQFDRALKIAEQAHSYYPEAAESYNYLGWVQLYRQNYDAAKQSLTMAISKNPQMAAAYLNFGLLFKQQGKSQAAPPYFEKASELAERTKDYSIRDRAELEIKSIKNQQPTNTTSQ